MEENDLVEKQEMVRDSKRKKSFFTEVKRGSIADGEGCERWLSFKEKKAKEKVQ